LRIVFCQREAFIGLGVVHLASVLSSQGHDPRVLIGSRPEELRKKLTRLSPDLVAFSLTTGLERWVAEVVRTLKSRPWVPVIVGGPHPTFFPEFIEEAPIDALCRGEAEETLSAYVRSLAGNGPGVTDIPNLWVRTDGRVVRNRTGTPVADLDRYPIPDIGIYFDTYPHLQRFYRHLYPIVSGRGCPMSCNYCFNKAFRELYPDGGSRVRRRSFEHIREELLSARRRYAITQVYFQDDTFLEPRSWFQTFSERYPVEVGLPYFCLVRAESIRESTARSLAASGCVGVTIGVETGSETVRRHILGKNVRNATIVQAVRLLHRHGITVQTDMILGLPGQDLEGALESLRFAGRIRSDFAWCSLLQPYPGTEIHRTVQRLARQPGSGWAFTGKAIPSSYFRDSVLDFPNRREIVHLQRLFQTLHRIRVLPDPWVRRILSAPLGGFYGLVHTASFNLSVRRIKRIPWPVFLREAFGTMLRRLPVSLPDRPRQAGKVRS